MIDNTCRFKRMSFMDGFSRYNQIKMYPGDEKHTSFWMSLGVYYYTMMPFGLKNAGATYQHAMSTIFHDYLWKTVECYVDDIAAKSRDKNDHLHDLRKIFDIMRAHRLKMNPTKSFLGVSNGKFLGFIVTSKGIHLDPDKVQAIQNTHPPNNLKELRSLQGRWLVANVAYVVSYFHTYYRIKACIVLINCLIYLQAQSLRRWREMSPKPTKIQK